jgi:hypothetical protein
MNLFTLHMGKLTTRSPRARQVWIGGEDEHLVRPRCETEFREAISAWERHNVGRPKAMASICSKLEGPKDVMGAIVTILKTMPYETSRYFLGECLDIATKT